MLEMKFPERQSAPPKITKHVPFNLSTEDRSSVKKERQSILTDELEQESLPVVFKARKMPVFREPSSPQRSTKSIVF